MNNNQSKQTVATPQQVPSNTPFEEVKPWSEPVVLGTLLNEIADRIQRHIICEKESVHAATLWIVTTYLVRLFDIASILIITAPEMRCGKSELKRLLARMVYRALEADNMSVAVLFRCFDIYSPTLLVDEYDTFIRKDDELRGIFNAGHQRGGCVWRCVGDNFHPTGFNVFGPKVLSGIGKLPATLMDRGIIIPLRRKLPTETVERQREVPASYFTDIKAKLMRVSSDYEEVISSARPELPDTLSDRARDNWEPLFQIAHAAGSDWVKKARQAALALSSREDDTRTIGVELLNSIYEVFSVGQGDRISSSELVKMLCDDAEKPWGTYNRGSPISPTQIAKRLGEFDIHSNTIRVNGTTAKGYHLKQFTDAFARYVLADRPTTSVPDVTPEPASSGKAPDVTFAENVTARNVTCNADVTSTSSPDVGCDGVTDGEGDAIVSDRTPNQEIVLTKFQKLLVQGRLDSFVGEHGDFLTESRAWPNGLPFDLVADQVKGDLRFIDDRLKPAFSRRILRDLVERGDLMMENGLVCPPDH